MLRRTVAAMAMFAGACGVLAASQPLSHSTAHHLGISPHPNDPQMLIMDNTICRDGFSILSGEENPAATYPALTCSDAYDLVPGAPATEYWNTATPNGHRLTTAVVWMDEAFGSAADASIAEGTVVGGTFAKINISCDDTPDYLLDSTSTLPIDSLADPGLVPEPVREQTTNWGAGTGLDGRDETMLDELIPPGWTRHVRYRADIDFLTIGDSTGLSLANPITLNAVSVTPPWGDTRATIVLAGADAVAPSAQLVLCFDSPLVSHWELNSAAMLTNPSTPGIYAAWTSYVSAPGTRDEQIQHVTYLTSCKHVGGMQFDSDNDCLADSLDADDASYDTDGDGLLDGIDVAWAGSEPCPDGGQSAAVTPDCDGDGRSDAEEHFSGTNPRLADSDGDGLVDAGLHLDCNGDGQADIAPRQSEGPHSGRSRVKITVMYCTPNGLNTLLGGLGGRPWGNVSDPPVAEDDCPLHAGPQTNSSSTDPDLDALPAPGDANGRFAGVADVTHPDATFSGDLCNPDNDNDGIPDGVEGSMYFDAAGAGLRFCNTSGVGVPAPTLANVRDTDGDGSIDGVECNLGKNPADATSKPLATMTAEQQTYFRLTQLTQQYNPLLVNLDDGSTIAGVSEARGLGAGGASQNDHDRDGCQDEVEMIDIDGSRVAGDADRLAIARAVLGVSTFAPPGSLTQEERRTADLDFNGVLGDPDRLAAARIVLTASLPSIPDYNLSCKAATIGYDAN